ncbi:hypothetical protein GCM10027160_23800 [Streptomyces calidiresistens]
MAQSVDRGGRGGRRRRPALTPGRNTLMATRPCRSCWDRLPKATRRALSHRGDSARALARLRALYDRIDEGRPLEQITIT